MIKYGLAVLILASCFSCEKKESNTLFISHNALENGIDFQNTITSTPDLNILNYIYFYNGAGVACGDFNNDDLPDLYFTSNLESDKLFLNNGNLQFEDITTASKINNEEPWTSGVTTVDINSDGLLDIYLCKLGSYKGITGNNLLYVNNGPDENGIPSFTERASEYGLDFSGFSTQATFFDFDLDGDLDMFLMNHSVNPNQNYGKGSQRYIPDMKSGDKLFENQNGQFVDISEAAGIIQSKFGYGLGVAVSDLNNDGYPDIYIGNDFFENDYLYMNQGDKTFNEVITVDSKKLGHTTHYSMGNDIADLNNDGLTDIVSVDMLPEDLATYKSSGTEFNYQIYNNYIKNGYSYQFMQNTLHINNGNGTFSETAYQNGIAATEWSWSPLIADFDMDGYNDIYITNGILGATNDMDFINFIANEEIQKSLSAGMDEKEMAFIDKIPEKKTLNYFFRNVPGQGFENMTETWSNTGPSFSNGAVYADLDKDGDLDIVTNNVNEEVFLLENTIANDSINWLTINFEGTDHNRFGIGTKVNVYTKGEVMLKENFTSRGYLSAVSPTLHFGLGSNKVVDSVHVVWPDKTYEVLYEITPNKELTLKQANASGDYYEEKSNQETGLFENVDPLVDFTHDENATLDFNRNPLMAFAKSNEGPDVSIADTNNDGFDDIFISGAKGQPSQLLVQQKDGTFVNQQESLFSQDAINEDISHLSMDINDDGYPELFVVSAGNEFESGNALFPRMYVNNNGSFEKSTNSDLQYPLHASRIKAFDLNKDGQLEFMISSYKPSLEFSNLLTTFTYSDSKFEVMEENCITDSFTSGINDFEVADLNQDGTNEIIIAGDWEPISVYEQSPEGPQRVEVQGLEDTHGFWNVIKAADFDKDGDIDLIAGNMGLNSRLKASIDSPVQKYTVDFDENGSVETVVTYFYQGIETPLPSKDELAKQMPGINKKFLSYNAFARAKLEEIFDEEKLSESMKQKVHIMATSYFENKGNFTFEMKQLPFFSQVSSVNAIYIEDFNNDGYPDLLLGGNNFEISTQLSSLDASHGIVLWNDKNGFFTEAKPQKLNISGAIRNIRKINYQGEDLLVITRNNDQPLFLKLKK